MASSSFITFIITIIGICAFFQSDAIWITHEKAIPSEYTFPLQKTALIMIDFQRAFLSPGGVGELVGNNVSLLQDAIEPARRMLYAARAAGIHVVHTMYSHLSDLSDCPESKRKINDEFNIGDEGPQEMGRILIRNELNTNIIDRLAPISNEKLIYKSTFGAFYKTDLNEYLMNHSITHLIFSGVTTEICVETTIREANDRGYKSLLLIDATASYFPNFKYNTIDVITSQNGIIAWAVNKTDDIIQTIRNTMYTIKKTQNDKILDTYFEAIQSMNINNIINIFDENAEIITSKRVSKGHKEISAFYLNGILKCKTFFLQTKDRFYSSSGDIAVEIILNCGNTKKQVGDYFVFKKDKIISIRVYSGSPYQP